jgi:uncharacterized protein YndB with AHSA1/START domain
MTDHDEVAAQTATAPEAAKELTITRLVDAPRELVFQAWTDAKHLARWWGPEGFTVPECESDPRPGGAIRIVMRGPDGVDYPLAGTYREVVAGERIVVDGKAIGPDGRAMLEVVNTATFADRGGKTEVTVQILAVALVPEAVPMLDGASAGWHQSLQRLDDMLTGADERQIVLARLIQAPRELVFKVFTEEEHVAHWYGPTGFSLTMHEMDVRPGGAWRFMFHGPDGVDYPNHYVYEEVTAPERLVYRHLEPPFRTTVTFDEFMGMTALTMRVVFETALERDETEAKVGAVEGGNQTLDRLGEYLAAM